MPQHRTVKRNISSDYPEVEQFATYLDELIKDRTSENKFLKAAQVGKSKLCPYLEGQAVPDGRVLDYYFRRPLEGFRPLTHAEHKKLLELHREACRVQDPKERTPQDKINFLREDLARARGELDDLNERLAEAIKQERAASKQVVRMRQDREILRAQLEDLTEQASALQRELQESGEEYQAKLEEANQEVNACRQELGACHQTISALEEALSEHVEISTALQRNLHAQYQENCSLQQRMAEDRSLFMRLVTHVGEISGLIRLSERLERSERTIAKQTEIIQSLAETNRALEQERDLATQERDFLRTAMAASPLTEAVPGPTQGGHPGDAPTTAPYVPYGTYGPYASAPPIPQPREPHSQWTSGNVVNSPHDLIERARAHLSPAEGSLGQPGQVA